MILMLMSGTMKGQPSGHPTEPMDCNSYFSSFPDGGNPMMVHFQDFSSGHINKWQWSFGDGTSTTQRNPVHIYTTGGTKFVCLTVSDTTPGNPCHDVHCEFITVHEPGLCIADYFYMIDSVDPSKVRFTDHSSGSIDRWHWDFGDGNFSDERNPIHRYMVPGSYKVCLDAYRHDSLSTCNDIKCDTVRILVPADCHAGFSSVLDTMNPVPNTYIFTGNSTGNPNQFAWRFDDGFTSSQMNVVHTFSMKGNHNVCLVVKKEDHGAIVCSDSICHQVSTTDYYNLGGHLFAGLYPINNPVPSGDTGVARIYRTDPGRTILFDSCRFTTLGYYAFPQTLRGEYLIRTGLSAGSANYAHYLPGYYPQALSWKEATPLSLNDSNVYLADVRLIPARTLAAGPGILSGKVVRFVQGPQMEIIPGAEVLLFDDQKIPLKFSVTDAEGGFVFPGIPSGAYKLTVEIPGSYSRITDVWVDQSEPVIDSLLLEVFDHDVTSVSETESSSFSAGPLYPNPATETVSVDIRAVRPLVLNMRIISVEGLSQWTGIMACSKGPNHVTIPVALLARGMYMLIIQPDNNNDRVIRKLLRY